jgi:hypothetical protein
MATIWRPLLDLTHRFSTLYLTAASKCLTLGLSGLKSQRIRILSSETGTSPVLSIKASKNVPFLDVPRFHPVLS